MDNKLKQILDNQIVPDQCEFKVLKQIWRSETDPAMVLITAFNYGVMQGIRKERNKKRRATLGGA